MVLCKLHLDDFGVSADGFLRIQQLLGVGQPSHQLCQGMLELAQCQESSFQLMLGKERDGKGELKSGRKAESTPVTLPTPGRAQV